MRMHKPPHPGEIIKSLCLEPVGLTVTEAAEGLGVSRKTPFGNPQWALGHQSRNGDTPIHRL